MDFNKELKTLKEERKVLEAKILDVKNLIERYSVFDAMQIGEFLADFMSAEDTQIEEDYSYQEGYYKMPNIIEPIKIYVKMLVSNLVPKDICDKLIDKESKEIDFTILNSLELDAKIIYLQRSEYSDDMIKFYSFFNIVSFYDFDNFSVWGRTEKYNIIKNFIDHIISYKIDNKLDTITNEQLNELKKQYYSEDVEKILQITKKYPRNNE